MYLCRLTHSTVSRNFFIFFVSAGGRPPPQGVDQNSSSFLHWKAQIQSRELIYKCTHFPCTLPLLYPGGTSSYKTSPRDERRMRRGVVGWWGDGRPHLLWLQTGPPFCRNCTYSTTYTPPPCHVNTPWGSFHPKSCSGTKLADRGSSQPMVVLSHHMAHCLRTLSSCAPWSVSFMPQCTHGH